jgi:subtilisin family serine protease
MFSRAVSSQFGVSNNAALTIVRVAKPVWGEDDGKDPNGNKLEPPSMRGINVIGAVDEAFNDILKRGLSHKAVVSMSLGDYDTNLPIPSSPGDGERYLMYTSIKRMMDYGVVVVASTGNRGDPAVSFSRSRYLCIILRVQFFQGPDYLSKVMVSTPGAWKSPSFPIIAVGAVDNTGLALPSAQYEPSSRFPDAEVDLWAPGQDVPCAGKISDLSMLATGSSPGEPFLACSSSFIP